MSAPLVTHDNDIQSPATNISNLQEDLCDKLEAILSYQSNDYGFRGMIKSTEKYDLICPGTP